MNKGVEILLARMHSNPQEFEEGNPKWASIIAPLLQFFDEQRPYNPYPFLTPEEMLALHTEYLSIQGEVFTREVLSQLLADDPTPPYAELSLAQQLTLALNK